MACSVPHQKGPTSHALHDLLEDAKARYAGKRPASRAHLDRASLVLPGGNTRTVLYNDPFPIVMARGEGARLWDIDQNEYLDFLGEFTAGLYGHSNPLIRAAIEEALAQGLSLSAHNVREAELAELIVARFGSIDRVRFTNSGTEANLMAISLARAATGRSKVMVFDGAYHGGVLTFLNGSAPINVPYDFVYGTYNDTEQAKALISQHGTDLAAVLAEPMLGAGGCLPGDPAFLAGLQSATRGVGALFILDEIQTSRLAGGGRQQQLGLEPDITTLGKYLGGGSSIGVFGGRARYMDLFDPSRPGALPHAGTFNNNVISMAAGAAGLRDVFTVERAAELTALGDAMRDRLNGLCRDYRMPMQFLGLGSLMNVHCRSGPVSRLAVLRGLDTMLRDLLFFWLADDGFYIAQRGLITLNLELTQRDIDSFCDSIDHFLSAHAGLTGGG